MRGGGKSAQGAGGLVTGGWGHSGWDSIEGLDYRPMVTIGCSGRVVPPGSMRDAASIDRYPVIPAKYRAIFNNLTSSIVIAPRERRRDRHDLYTVERNV